MFFDGADEAEAVHDFIANEIGVVAANFAVVEVVVLAAVLHKGSQGGGQLFRLVFGDQVHHMIRDERRKPANVFARGRQVVGGPNGRGGHDFKLAEVAACFLCAFANESEAPIDQIGIGKLENHAVADAAGSAKRLRTVARDPDAGDFAIGPGESCVDAVKVNRLAGIQVAKHTHKFFQCAECRRLLSEHATRTVTTADTKFHATAGG